MEIKPITKAVRSETNSFEMVDVTEGILRSSSVKPGLLTALLGGDTNDFSITNDKVVYDELTEIMQLPNGKRFDEIGGAEVTLDNARELMYKTGSYGATYKVKPADVSGKRKPFSNELYSMEDRVAEGSLKMDKLWMAFDELSFAKVLTTDANWTFGGPATSYNFYTDIYGGARPAAAGNQVIDFTADTVEDKTTVLLDQLQEECAKSMTTYNSAVMLCGSDFFTKRFAYERDQGISVLALNQTDLDLSALGVPRGSFSGDDVVFKRRFFTSALDGITYINVPDSIGGQLLMGDAGNAFLIPAGADNMLARVYSPAQTTEYVNTMGLKKYAEYGEHKRKGVVYSEECNVLYMNRTPKLVIHLVDAA